MTSSDAIDAALQSCQIKRVTGANAVPADDVLAVEEPLEIRLRWQQDGQWHEEPLTITMRTPGHDDDLAAGLLFSEGIVTMREQIMGISPGDTANTRVVELAAGHQLALKRFQRQFASTASCGVCGKLSIESLQLLYRTSWSGDAPLVSAALLQQWPGVLRSAQPLFARTGGVHAAGLFDAQGNLLVLREDIGRHNAVDKLIGACRYTEAMVLQDKVLLVSGRAGFELVQKALASNIPFMAAVGAPTSLAVELAQRHDMTLVGFLKRDSLNIYSGAERVLV